MKLYLDGQQIAEKIVTGYTAFLAGQTFISTQKEELMTDKIDDPFKSVYAAKTAQSVWNDLRSLKQLRPIRWIWELLQNASDASPPINNYLIAEVKYRQGELVFSHNGRSFTELEVAHLIASGSTKYEDEESIGEFGTGFLTTHLLSLEIEVSGQLDNGQKFAFPLIRDMKSRQALYESMQQAEKDFKHSLNHPKTLIPQPFTTQFIYPIKESAVGTVRAGIETLEQCAPYVLVFNKKFDRINIDIDTKEDRKVFSFQAITSPELDGAPIQQITVTECENGNAKVKEYLLAQSEKGTSINVPLESNRDKRECLSVGNIPRIYKVFPLIGTESFSFPAVINNSSDFMPTVARDDIPLEESSDDVNAENRSVIEDGYEFLVKLLEHAASKGWHHVYQWAEVPIIQHEDEKARAWLKTCIREKFTEEICQKHVIVTEFGQTKTLKEACLPLAENNENVKELWSLLNDLQEYRDKLPRRDEVAGWCHAIKSWSDVYEKDVSNLPDIGVIDGWELADHIENKCSGLKDLQGLLQEDICAIDWLNRLYRFLRKDKKIDNVIRINRLVLSQAGEFNLLKYLHRDQDIGEELKDIAELLGWQRIRHQLRDPRLTSLDTEQGADDWDSEYTFENLHTRIQEQVKPNPSNDFKEASARFFAWIIGKKNYSRLGGFPAFAADDKSGLVLPNPGQDSPPPLAPVPAWSEGLAEFEDLFPKHRILANDFFKEEYPSEVWEQLDEQGFIRWNMIIQRSVTDLKLLSPEVSEDKQDHKTAEPIIGVTDFVERVAIMDWVRNTRERAYLFWRFLTEWLIKVDSQYLELRTEKCNSCENDISHEYRMAVWLEPVRNNLWIHNDKDKQRFKPNARELARVLRDNGWKINSLDENPDAVKLLKAIGITPSDFRLEFVADDEEKRDILINTATRLNNSPQLLHHMQGNENLPQDIEKILEVTRGDLSQVVKDAEERKEQQDRVAENRDFGKRVEKQVRQLLDQDLKPKGFSVTPKHTGSDLEISEETFDISTQEIIRNGKKWLVEIKGTRIQNVKMSFEQTKNALDKKEEFLLCVVPILENIQPDFDTVRKNILFIKNIHRKLGNRVATLCSSIDRQKNVEDHAFDDASPGITLDFERGKAGIRVQKSVWEDEGFPLEKLAEHLK